MTNDMENLRNKNKREIENNRIPLQQTRMGRRQNLRT
jgi:hypothetical protein